MAERRKPRKRSAEPARETKRLSLLDLPPVKSSPEPAEQRGVSTRGAPSDRRSTLLPAAAEPAGDASLDSLARAARRASNPPQERPPGRRSVDSGSVAPPSAGPPAPNPNAVLHAVSVAPVLQPVPFGSLAAAARQPLPTEPSPPPRFASTMPPPVQMPSRPPLVRAERTSGAWIRTLGVIVLSASVGAIVSSTMWGVRLGFLEEPRADTSTELSRVAGATAAPSCTTTPSGDAAVVPAAGPVMASEAPRIAFDALPVQSGKRRAAVVEAVSLESSPGGPRSDTPPGRRATRETGARSNRERRSASASPAPAEALPVAPSRDAISQAVGRAAAAATACDAGANDGKVAVTFAPSGAVQSVSLIKGFGDAEINSCVLRAFGRARVPAFSGEPVEVRKSVAW